MKFAKSGLILIFATLLPMLNGCSTTPEKPVDEKPAIPSISGTKWHYQDDDWQYDLEFLANGKLRTTHPNDTTPDNDSWEQNGAEVHFYFNDKYSHYQGVIANEKLISGTAQSSTGGTWNWKATR